MKEIQTLCLARAGLLGNPSDGFGGRTVSFSLANWKARARFGPADRVFIRLGRESASWNSLQDLLEFLARNHHPQPLRLVTASLLQFHWFYGERAGLPEQFSLEVDSDIPEQVGLAGSSAIVIATLRALLEASGLRLPPEMLASLGLRVETVSLGIPAGLQDRVAQSLEGLIAMDFSPSAMRETGGLLVGTYQPLPVTLLPPSAYVAWSRRGRESTEVLHSDLRQRFLAGETAVVQAMARFAEIAREGTAALVAGNVQELNRLINANFDLRKSICRLNPLHLEMVETARETGSSAKYCGSGGAIVGLLAPGMTHAGFAAVMARIDCDVIVPDLSRSSPAAA